ncbi:hypothetical protein [Senegalia massiliensis]|uniref:Uncharacterized protein n=1 Tax=Senegalia massiliensis TaxID=1720316 RepID=A0A845QXB5_9CLOT|nr:hypothetical protein [Senegalia massiliensis]NBI07597.1 hypothetical protein [Senegalia massiliensis]
MNFYNRKRIISFLIIFFIIFNSFSPVIAANDDDEDKGFFESVGDGIKDFTSVIGGGLKDLAVGAVDIAFAEVVRSFTDIFYFIFYPVSDVNTIDEIVYNQGGENLILRGGLNPKIAKVLMQLFLWIQSIATAFFIPMLLWLAVAINKAGDSPQRKAHLKDKATRIFVTWFWLISMPQLLDWVIIFNNAFVKGLFMLLQEITGSDLEFSGGLLVGFMRALAFEKTTFALSVIYAMTVFLNIWMLIYYFIRDIAIAYLFVLFPIIAVTYPLEKGALISWWKEMCSNIFTQAIHAFVMITVMAITVNVAPKTIVGSVAESVPLSDALFIMISFGLVIPFTATVKKMLRLEGSIGGAKSFAGLGAMYGAMRIGQMGYKGIKDGATNLREGNSMISQAQSNQQLLNKKGVLNQKTGMLEAVNKRGEIVTQGKIDDMLDQGKKQHRQGVSSLALGSTAGLSMGAGASVFGVQEGLMVGAGATAIGSSLGSGIGKGYHNVSNGVAAYKEDREFEGMSEKQQDEKLGLTSPVLQGTQFKEDEKKALRQQNLYRAFGLNNLADKKYAEYTPYESSNEEIENLQSAELYVDKNQSVLYGRNEDGSKKILRTGNGDPTARQPYTRQVEFNDNGNGTGLKGAELQELNQLRNNLGVNTMTYSDQDKSIVEGRTSYFDPIRDVQSMQNKSLEDGLVLDERNIEEINLPEDNRVESKLMEGVGYSLTSNNGTTYFKRGSNGSSEVVATSTMGNPKLSQGEMEISPIKYDNGQVLQDQMKYAIEGTGFHSPAPTSMKPFNKAISPEIKENIEPNSQIMVTVDTESSNTGDYNFYNRETQEFIGSQPIPQTEIQKEMHGQVYNVQVDGLNNMMIKSSHKMTAEDYHLSHVSNMKNQSAPIPRQNNEENIRREIQTKIEENIRQQQQYEQTINNLSNTYNRLNSVSDSQ